MAKKPKKRKMPEIPEKDWEPSLEDAINLAALRLYAITIEELALLIYRSDPEKERPKFKPLQQVLAQSIRDLRNLSKGEKGKGGIKLSLPGCPDDDELGPDGLCHPPGSYS